MLPDVATIFRSFLKKDLNNVALLETLIYAAVVWYQKHILIGDVFFKKNAS